MKWFLAALAVTLSNSSIAMDKWRGLIKVQPDVYLTLGFNIDLSENTITLDSPNQGMFGKPPTEFTISEKQVFFKDKDLHASFSGHIENDIMRGTFKQGEDMPIVLHRLSTLDLARLKFEGAYFGELDVNGNTLPLILQVAAIKDGFYTSLDSPSQQSYSIPVTKFAIDDNQMTFNSEMIGASFSGFKSEYGYEGKFIQGFEIPLVLRRRSSITYRKS